MTDIATNFPPQTYSSSFFLNPAGEGEGGCGNGDFEDKDTQSSSTFLDCFLTKVQMFGPDFSTLLLLIGYLTWCHGQNASCPNEPSSKVRIFNSLVAFQGNKLSFDLTQANNEGNSVILAEENLETLHKNSFFAFDSGHVQALSVINHKIRVIDEEAFLSLSCLVSLDLQKNLIEVITKGVFKGVGNLRELNLGENRLREILEHTFSLTPLLKKLNLTRNMIKTLPADSFVGLSLLEELDLSFNFLTRILPDSLQYFGQLVDLDLGSNEIEHVDLEKWTSLSRLQTLNLSDNALESFDVNYDYSFSSSLIRLYLDNNYITKLNYMGLRKHLPSLQELRLEQNPWSCADLYPILTSLNDSRINYSFSGSSAQTGLNVNGIACNRSIDTYKRNKWSQINGDTTLATPTSKTAPLSGNSTQSSSPSNEAVVESLKSIQTLIVCLFIFVVVFISLDVAVRSGCLSTVIRGRGNYVNDHTVEHISLLRERS